VYPHTFAPLCLPLSVDRVKNLIFAQKLTHMKKDPQQNEDPQIYNGVTLGALMILIGLVWFTIPLLGWGQVLIVPWVVSLVGLITLIRHSRKK